MTSWLDRENFLNLYSIAKECPKICDEINYQQRISAIKFQNRMDINILEWADNKYKLKKLIKSTKLYRNCIKNTNNLEKKCIERLTKTSTDNLIKILLEADKNLGVIIEEDKNFYEFSHFFAQFAASINFWIGCSAIVVIEIVDFFCQIYFSAPIYSMSYSVSKKISMNKENKQTNK